jgi:hypothetical protein
MEKQMNLKITLISSIFVLALGIIIGRYSVHPQEVLKTKAETSNRETIKNNKTVSTVIKENKDGSKETTILEVDKSELDKAYSSKTETLRKSRPNYKIIIGAESKSLSFYEKTYTFIVQKRVLGPIFLGGQYSFDKNDKKFGFNLGVEF